MDPNIAIAVEDPTSPDAQLCITQYLEELDARLETGFDPSRSSSADADELREPDGLLLLARHRDRPVGCAALKLHGTVAEIKRMWVDPSVRGMGVGRQLLVSLEEEARERRIDALQLETNTVLAEAITLYESSGYVRIERFSDDPFADHWFEKRLD